MATDLEPIALNRGYEGVRCRCSGMILFGVRGAKKLNEVLMVPKDPTKSIFFFSPPAPAICAGSSGDLLPPSPPAEKATACQDQTGQASTCDGAGNTRRWVSPKRIIE